MCTARGTIKVSEFIICSSYHAHSQENIDRSCYHIDRSCYHATEVSYSLPLFVITKKRTTRGWDKTKHKNRTQSKHNSEQQGMQKVVHQPHTRGTIINCLGDGTKERKKIKGRLSWTDFWGELRLLEEKGFWRGKAFHASAPWHHSPGVVLVFFS